MTWEPHPRATVQGLCFFFVAAVVVFGHAVTCGILVPQPGIKPTPLAVEARSLNHWTARESPVQWLWSPCLTLYHPDQALSPPLASAHPLLSAFHSALISGAPLCPPGPPCSLLLAGLVSWGGGGRRTHPILLFFLMTHSGLWPVPRVEPASMAEADL